MKILVVGGGCALADYSALQTKYRLDVGVPLESTPSAMDAFAYMENLNHYMPE